MGKVNVKQYAKGPRLEVRRDAEKCREMVKKKKKSEKAPNGLQKEKKLILDFRKTTLEHSLGDTAGNQAIGRRPGTSGTIVWFIAN